MKVRFIFEYLSLYIYIYIYIWRERERERERILFCFSGMGKFNIQPNFDPLSHGKYITRFRL